LTKAAAIAYGPERVRLNCIAPGDVNTPLVQAYFAKVDNPAELRAGITSNYALRRIAEPEDVARAAVYLTSDASSFVPGTTLVIDGELTSKCYPTSRQPRTLTIGSISRPCVASG
jgi:NAD(P)-dependent dehydrogenase (short-subunit alcohol dehydrogenase family)